MLGVRTELPRSIGWPQSLLAVGRHYYHLWQAAVPNRPNLLMREAFVGGEALGPGTAPQGLTATGAKIQVHQHKEAWEL